MSIELTTQAVNIEKIFFDNFAEQGIDCDINLPDYCPDIVRVLKCTVQNCITNTKVSGDRAMVEGTAVIRVIYADDKNCISCYEQEYPFSKYAELGAFYDNAVLSASIKTEYINCRAVSKRRLDIHGIISIRFKLFGTEREKIIGDAVGDGIQLKRKGVDIDSFCAVAMKEFQISQALTIPDGKSGIGKVIDVISSAILNETKIIKGKALLKGELAVSVTYSSDKANNSTETVVFNIPFNEIVEAENLMDDCTVYTQLTVNQISVEPKTDNEEEFRKFDINAGITACVNAFCPQSVKFITDAYSTDRELETKYKTVEFKKINQIVSEKIQCKSSIDLSSLNVNKIFAVIADMPTGKCNFSQNKMNISGKIPVKIILIDEENNSAFCEREAEFEWSQSANGNTSNLYGEPNFNLTGFTYNFTSDGKIDFRAEVIINACIYQQLSEKIITEMQSAQGDCKKNKTHSLTIYFCSGGENVWDIARRYNSTVNEIMDENGLVSDYIENKTMLMIPIN